jgi:hypothetical protein
MYESELRTCALGAIICMLFGAGIGYGWHVANKVIARARLDGSQ